MLLMHDTIIHRVPHPALNSLPPPPLGGRFQRLFGIEGTTSESAASYIVTQQISGDNVVNTTRKSVSAVTGRVPSLLSEESRSRVGVREGLEACDRSNRTAAR